MRKVSLLLLIPLLAFLSGCNNQQHIEASSTLLLAAEQAGQPVPLVSKKHPSMNLDEAYLIQEHYVEKQQHQGKVITGYKAGLTSSASQARFDSDTPLAGVLFADGLGCAVSKRVCIDVLAY